MKKSKDPNPLFSISFKNFLAWTQPQKKNQQRTSKTSIEIKIPKFSKYGLTGSKNVARTCRRLYCTRFMETICFVLRAKPS